MMSVEPEALIVTAVTLEEDEIWLDGLLLVGAADVATGTTTKLVDVL